MQKYFKKGRVILALLFFILIISAFADIKGKLPSDYFKSVFYLQFVPSILEFLTSWSFIFSAGFIVVLIITLIAGRVYCSTICPLGVLQDIILFIKRRFSPKQRFRFRKALNVLRYSILGVIVLYILFAGLAGLNRLFLLNLLDPYATFGRMGSHILQPLFLAINNTAANILSFTGLNTLESKPVNWLSLGIASGMLILVSTMSLWQGRLYCNSVCPVGSFLGLLSKVSFFKLKIDTNSCTNCGKCQFACKAGCIDTSNKYIDETRCVSCFNCISACSKSAISYKPATKKSTEQAIIVTEPASDSRRRLFVLTTLAYLASKVSIVKGQEQTSAEAGSEIIGFQDKGSATPPGSMSLEHLKSRCITCHLCVSVCPTKVLQPSTLEFGFTGMMLPRMDFETYFCNFECTKCGEVCPSGAILALAPETKKTTQIGKAVFRKEFCIVEKRHKSCGSCSEHCPTQAVSMIPYTDGLTIPQVNQSICIGCGACEYACPADDPHVAIYVVANNTHQVALKPVSEKIEYKETEEFPF